MATGNDFSANFRGCFFPKIFEKEEAHNGCYPEWCFSRMAFFEVPSRLTIKMATGNDSTSNFGKMTFSWFWASTNWVLRSPRTCEKAKCIEKSTNVIC